MFNMRDPESTLTDATASAIREVVGRNVLDFILTDGRTEVARETQELLQATLDSYGAGVTVYEVNLQDANFPREVESSVQDSIKAREDRERRILEAQSYSNEILPRARGEAAVRRQEAEAYRGQVVANAEGESDRFTSDPRAISEGAGRHARAHVYRNASRPFSRTRRKCSSTPRAATTCCICRSSN